MKLLSLLKSLQTDEFKAFEKFLLSPFFKGNTQHHTFFKYLCKHHPAFNPDKTALDKAYRACFGQADFTDSKLYNLMSTLARQLEHFIVVSLVLSDEPQKPAPSKAQLLAHALGERNMGNYFRTEAQQLAEKIGSRTHKSMDDYLAMHQLHHEVYYNPDTPKFSEYPPHLQLSAQNLDLYYCLGKLRCTAEMKTRERITGISYEFPMLETVLAQCADEALLRANPLLNIYYQLVNLQVNGVEEAVFRTLLQQFQEQFSQIPKIDQLLLLSQLINLGIFMLSRGGDIEKDLFELYKLALENGALVEGNRITHLSFINIVHMACNCGEIDWAKRFLVQVSPYLEDSKRQATLDLSQAVLYYAQDLFDEAQRCLHADIYVFPHFDIIARALLLKIAFDRYQLYHQDYDFLASGLNSFERFLQTKQLSPEKKNAQLNWVRFVKKMASSKFATMKVPSGQKAAMAQKLRDMQPLVYKKWLMERLERL